MDLVNFEMMILKLLPSTDFRMQGTTIWITGSMLNNLANPSSKWEFHVNVTSYPHETQ